jgi:hypothetical protein
MKKALRGKPLLFNVKSLYEGVEYNRDLCGLRFTYQGCNLGWSPFRG